MPTPDRHSAARWRLPALLAVAVLLLGAYLFIPSGAGGASGARSSAMPVQLPDQRLQAPEFPAEFDWLNLPSSALSSRAKATTAPSTSGGLTLHGDLKGRVVVIDFWTYCCINCMHILPDLEYLEQKYANDPVTIIGCHSAKFDNESDPAQIALAIRRYRIKHPVIVDRDMRLWRAYGVHAWPTFIIIDPAGKIVGSASGEGQRDLLDQVIAQLLTEARAQGTLAPGNAPGNVSEKDKPAPAAAKPVPTTGVGPDSSTQPATLQPQASSITLSFPGKILVAAGPVFYIADSSHDRIVMHVPGQPPRILGSGKRGFADGPIDQAQFNNPQGLALDGSTLYVADTDNHALRRIDLQTNRVTTLAGDGQQSFDRTGGHKGTAQGLASPWDIALHQNKLYIAMAGTHQIWVHDLVTGISRRFAGSGREDIIDGPAGSAALAQPSGLAILGDWLYFADSEVSAVRRARLADGQVETLIGSGLFNFGFRDGPWDAALLQHPLGIAALDPQRLVVADTYNHRLRVIDLKDRTIRTLYGGQRAQLNEPGGVAVSNGMIYVADTNNQRIVRVNPADGQAEVVFK